MVSLTSRVLLVSCLVLNCACGAPALSSLSSLNASVAYEGDGRTVKSLAFELMGHIQECPRLEAQAALNGQAMEQTQPGGWIQAPDGSGQLCVLSRYEFSSKAPVGGSPGLAITLSDKTAEFKLESPNALEVTMQAEGNGTRPGQTFAIAPTRYGTNGTQPTLYFRAAGTGGAWESLSATVTSGGVIEATTPQVAAGRYEWMSSMQVEFPTTTCSGFATCTLIRARINSTGVFDILP